MNATTRAAPEGKENNCYPWYDATGARRVILVFRFSDLSFDFEQVLVQILLAPENRHIALETCGQRRAAPQSSSQDDCNPEASATLLATGS